MDSYEPFDPGVKIRQFQQLYRIDGARYDRLSSILACYPKPGLEKWQRKKGFERADYERERAATFGKVGHAMIEAINTDRDYDLDALIVEHDPDGRFEFAADMFVPYVESYWDWFGANVKRVMFCEQTVWSPSGLWAGTDDTVYLTRDDRILVADNKFSKNVSPVYRLQTVAYADAFLELGWLDRVDGRQVIHLPHNGGGLLRTVEFDDRAADLAAFHNLLGVFRHHKAHEDDWKK